MSQLFLRTLRDDPADAEVASHKLLIRAGYIRPVAPGLYSWLPLGLRVLRRIERIVREEMNAIGGQEILFPALLPRAPYETTNRWTEYGDSVFRLQDRRGNDYLLGPTHEELFTLTVKGEYSSYKDFPVLLYQIQNKYRDEARPRAGILRVREFVMKDSYSFDIDDAGLKAAYHAHREAYQRIFGRLQVRYVIVSAVSGIARRRRFRQVSVPGEGLHRTQRIAGQRCSLPRRSAGGGRHQLDHRGRRARAARRGAGRRPGLHRGRHHRGRRGARR
jgi:prolyl-tRNA synthetase